MLRFFGKFLINFHGRYGLPFPPSQWVLSSSVSFSPILIKLSCDKVIALEGLNISFWNLFGNIKFETYLSPLHEINLEIQVQSALNEKQTRKTLFFYKNRD